MTVEYCMARGFESKDVEYQQAERERARSGRADAASGQTPSDGRRASLELTLAHLRADLGRARAEAHRAMLERLPAHYQADDYLFVHAGVDPDRPLSEQGPETWMYIRGRFLRSEKACDYVVVHGHTPEDAPSDLPWRIGVDTGIYFNGVLSAVRLHGETREVLSVEGDI